MAKGILTAVVAFGGAAGAGGQELSQGLELFEKKTDVRDSAKKVEEKSMPIPTWQQNEQPLGESRSIAQIGARFVKDQTEIWSSPARLRFSDLQWLVPAGGFAAGLFVTDNGFSKHLSRNPARLSHYNNLSNAGVAALIGGAGGMWLLGHAKHNEHWSETGFLAGEAALNSLAVVEGMKYSLRRERPFQGDGSGAFFKSGGTSFPSVHAAVAWSVAGVLAHEYPGPLTKLMAYGLASAVSISRVRARQHFPSDTFIGGMIGDLVAQHIYSEYHNPDLGGAVWESISHVLCAPGRGANAPDCSARLRRNWLTAKRKTPKQPN